MTLSLGPGMSKATSAGLFPSTGAPDLRPFIIIAPAVTGTPSSGQTLTTTDGTWGNSPSSYTYQWRRDSNNIAGETNNTYLLTDTDQLSLIDCVITATNATGSRTAASNSVAIAENVTPPVIIPMDEIPGLVAWWDGKVYSGSGNWLNQISGGSAYDVTPTNPALHNGQNLWTMNNTAYFTGTNTTFLKNLHKTTGGQSFTWFGRFRTPAASITIDSVFGTASTTGNQGIEIRGDSSGIMKIDQFAGGAAVTVQSTAVTNRAFSSGSTGWTLGAGWSVPGVTTADALLASSALSQTLPMACIEGVKYRVSYTVSNYATGSCTISLGGTDGTARTANGTYTEDIVCGATSVLALTGAAFTASVDNFDVRMAANEYYTHVIKYDSATNQLGFSMGVDAFQLVASGWGASSTDPTYDFNLGSDGNNLGPMDNTSQLLGMGFVDHAMTDAELTTLNDSILAHFTPPAATVPTQAIKIVGLAGNQAVYFNYDMVNDGGAAITDVLVETSTNGVSGWSTVSHSAFGSNRDIAITGLTNGVAAYYRLSPINAVGTAASPSDVKGPYTPVAEGTNPYDEQYFKITRPVTSVGLRTGNAQEITQPALLTHYSAHFSRADGKFIFQAQDGGAATATATSCRSEFRHLTNVAYTTATEDTLKFAVWGFDNGAGSYPAGQKAALFQIHDVNDPWFKLVYTFPSTQGGSNGQLRVLYKPTEVSSFTASISTTVMTVTDTTGGPLYVGQAIYIGSTSIGTITSFGTGTGGTGTYNISVSQTRSSTAMTGAVSEDVVMTLKTGMSDGDITTVKCKYVITSQVGDLVNGELQFFVDGNLAGGTPDKTTANFTAFTRRTSGLTYYWKRGIYPTPSGQVGWLFRAEHYTQSGQYIP